MWVVCLPDRSRVAFGATGGRVSGMVLKRGLVPVGAGATARVLQSQLYQVGTLDPLTVASVAVGFVVAASLRLHPP